MNPSKLKVLVVGAATLIGRGLAGRLDHAGHVAVPAPPSTGVDADADTALVEALTGVQVVVDVTDPPRWEDDVVLDFFVTSTRNLLAAERFAGVTHHLALTLVGAENQPSNGYCRAKVAQEELIAAGSIPYTILRTTQFFEFIGTLADLATDGATVRLAPVRMQPVAADDVIDALAALAATVPLDTTLEVAGPEQRTLDEFARRLLAGRGDPRTVVTDPAAAIFGDSPMHVDALIPGPGARVGNLRFDEWLERSH